VVGVGMVGTETCVTEGDLARSNSGRYRLRNRQVRETELSGANEESERLIVALTPGESREQQRGRSQERRTRDVWASDRISE